MPPNNPLTRRFVDEGIANGWRPKDIQPNGYVGLMKKVDGSMMPVISDCVLLDVELWRKHAEIKGWIGLSSWLQGTGTLVTFSPAEAKMTEFIQCLARGHSIEEYMQFIYQVTPQEA